MKSIPLALVSLFVLAGCGGGGSSHSDGPATPAVKSGTATLTVKWPTEGRQIPLAANSLVATLKLNGAAVATRTLARPAPTATFTGLAYGTYTVDVKAYPTADGSGVAQATGLGTAVVTEDAPGAAGVALASTVAHLAITPAALRFPKGSSTTLAVSATDADGNIVLLAAGGGTETVAWTLDAATNATLVPTGLTATLTGVHSGAATVTASMVVDDAGSLATATAATTVTPIDDGSTTVTIH